jgi:hypothetical protein
MVQVDFECSRTGSYSISYLILKETILPVVSTI